MVVLVLRCISCNFLRVKSGIVLCMWYSNIMCKVHSWNLYISACHCNYVCMHQLVNWNWLHISFDLKCEENEFLLHISTCLILINVLCSYSPSYRMYLICCHCEFRDCIFFEIPFASEVCASLCTGKTDLAILLIWQVKEIRLKSLLVFV